MLFRSVSKLIVRKLVFVESTDNIGFYCFGGSLDSAELLEYLAENLVGGDFARPLTRPATIVWGGN